MADEQYNDLETDIANIGKFANDPSGTIQPRSGGPYKNIRKVIEDAESLVANQNIGDGAVALINQRISKYAVPLCVATVGTNSANSTVYNVTIPAVYNAAVEGQRFSFVIPATNLSSNIKLDVSSVGQRDAFFSVGQKLRAGWTATFYANNGGGKWNFENQVPDGLTSQNVENKALIAAKLIGALSGVQIGEPLNGNPNELYVPYAPLQDSVPFEFIVTATTTENLIITNSNGERRAVVDGTAGKFVENTIARLQYSGGFNNYTIITASKAMPTLKGLNEAGVPIDLWAGFSDTTSAHYGDIAKGGNNQPIFTPRNKRIVGRGSSVVTDSASGVNRAGAAPAGQYPLKILADALTEAHGPGNTYTPDNWSKGGTVQSQGASQYGEAIGANPAVPWMLFDGFGMNDMQMSSYNSGQQTPEYFSNPIYYEQEIRDRLNGGVYYYVACTSPHDNTDLQTNTFGGNNLQWPYAKAAPVADAELVPPYSSTPALNKSITTAKDWTGRGIKRVGNTRGEHVNELMRAVLRKLHNEPAFRHRIFLLDVEWSWFRYGVEQYTLTQLFGSETVHPQLLGHQVSYWRCIRDFVAASRRGFGDQWIFRGEYAG